MNGPAAGCDPVAQHDGLEHPAALEDLAIVFGSDERLTVAVPEHQRVEGRQQQSRRRGIG